MIDAIANSLLMAGIPLGLSGVGWMIIKVVQHDAWLTDMKATMVRIEAKLDKLILES